MPDRPRASGGVFTSTDARPVIWAWLLAHPGRSSTEISRCLGRRSQGSTLKLLERMEADRQVTREHVSRPGQGKPVSQWSAVPGAFG